MNKHIFVFLFIIGAFCLCSCADDFATRINLDGNSSGEDFNSEAALYGTVQDNYGKPVAGVLVSDGIQTTETDAEGNWQLFSDLTLRRFVFITIPAGYEVPSKNGIPQFWQRISADEKQFKADFMLMKRTGSDDRYTILMTADPQIRARNAGTDQYLFHSIDIYEDMCADMKELAATITDRPLYSICLGDMVHNNMSLWEDYCNGIKDFSFPVFHVIGNHDHIQNAASDDLAVAEYEKYLGPTNYAVDLGQLHYIFLDDINMKDNSALSSSATGAYQNGLSDETLEWLRGHLAHIDKSKTLMVCAHSSLYKKIDYNPSSTDLNATAYTNLFSGYKYVHSWAGHQHYHFNYAYAAEETGSRFANVESHILGRSTGMLGLNASVNSCGTPRGYMVIEVEGENISWYYKPCNYEEGKTLNLTKEYQIRAYYPGELDPGSGVYYSDRKVYANVWNHDAHWGPVYYTDNGKTKVAMTKGTTYDGYANYLYFLYKDQYTVLEKSSTPHMFSIEPSEGATSATIETTDRFGNHYTADISW